ncbi:MAG: c-type cytochrome [Nitrosomonadales bacterium]|nr:c-type cytochrome [Nitrosomonadales bacterium]
MKFRYLIAMTVALSVSAPVYSADNVETLFNDSNCNNCHFPLKDTAGPSIKAIAKKYKGNKDAQAMLEKKVRDGGTGTWGVVTMPATPATVSDENIKAMVSWMLTQEGEALFKQHNCTTCHAIDKKLLGPSLKDIAAKYASDKDAPQKLMPKVRNGGSGAFGSTAMPATGKSVSDNSIFTMLEWIVSLPATPTTAPTKEAVVKDSKKTDKKAK